MSECCCSEDKNKLDVNCCSDENCCTDGVSPTENSCCCSCGSEGVSTVSTSLSFKDVLGAWKVRLGIGRMNYRVEPKLYAVGNPNADSDVLVSANYKLTFDALRKNLAGLNCWLLILDTKAVNVWCAAGKGTFGTDELVKRIDAVGLSEIVTHRKLILPQLGASGVNAHEVAKRTGFSVIFGPVRASDVKAFIGAGYKATKEMRTVQFTLRDRLVLTPMELIPAVQKSLPVLGALFITNQFAKRPFDKHDVTAYTGAVVAGSVITPALLPYIPGKAFALKGWLVGLGWTATYFSFCEKKKHTQCDVSKRKTDEKLLLAGELLLLPAVSSYIAMNFTGSSTYTSPSGVQKEMNKALPLIIGAAAVGGALTLGVHLFGGRKKR